MKLGQGSSSHHQRPVLGAAQKAQEPGRRPTASLFNNASKLTMVAVVLGLLSSLPSGAFSVPRQADAEAPPSAIPIKLSPASFPSRKRQDASLAGAKLVESLVLHAPAQTSDGEIRPSRPSPLHHRQNRPRRPSQRPHPPHPPTSTPGPKSPPRTPPPTSTSSPKPSSPMGHGGWMQRGRRGRGRRGWRRGSGYGGVGGGTVSWR